MPYVSVHKDLTAIKNKAVGNLTMRQAICMSAGAAAGLAVYFLTKPLFGNSMSGVLMLAAMLPLFVLGMYEKDGLPLEKYMKYHWETHHVRNTERPYVSENIYEAYRKQLLYEEEVKKILEEMRKRPPRTKLEDIMEGIRLGTGGQALKDAIRAKAGKTAANTAHPSPGGTQKPGNRKDEEREKEGRQEEKTKEAYRVSPNAPLPLKTRNELAKAVRKYKRNGKIPESAQETIPYKRIWKNGIIEVTEGYYTKTIGYSDITYELAANEDKNAIFENWCDFLNYFDETIHFQLSFYNQEVDKGKFVSEIDIPLTGDRHDDIREEYSSYLREQHEKGNNGLSRSKYITFGIQGNSYEEAKNRIAKISREVIANFSKNDVKSWELNGYERLKLMWQLFHPGTKEKFLFNWDVIGQTGITTKDFIAPTSFDFKDSKRLDATRYFKFADKIGAVNRFTILSGDLPDTCLSKVLSIDSNIAVSIHVNTLDQNKAMKLIKKQMTNVNKMKIDEQKRAVRGGYDMDILPPDIKIYAETTEDMLDGLQKRNERYFICTITTLQYANSKKELDSNIFTVNGIIQSYNCALKRLDNRQEQGFMSMLPLGYNNVEFMRGLLTTELAIFVPFTTEELFQVGTNPDTGKKYESLYYGINSVSGNLIMADRKNCLKNPNGLILGQPGSGKSFATKREIENVFFCTDDDILVLDPESEYGRMALCNGGQVIEISMNSLNYINPMEIDLTLENNEEDKEYDPVADKSDFVLSLCELILGGKRGLEPLEVSIIDRCTRAVYEKFLADPVEDNQPTLTDLYNELRKYPHELAQEMSMSLEMYVTGSYRLFNHQSNVNLGSRFIVYDIKNLKGKLREIGMLIVQSQIWSRVAKNRAHGRTTRVYMDEFHLLLKRPQTAEYSIEIWKRFRKWGGIPTGITQNVKDLLASSQIENILENSPFILMLSQGKGDSEILSHRLGISEFQRKYIEDVDQGRGLLFFGDKIIPFEDDFPKDTKLYGLMTTKLDEVTETA